jgi:hypothetical protein
MADQDQYDTYTVKMGDGGWYQIAQKLSKLKGYPIDWKALQALNPQYVKKGLWGNGKEVLKIPPKPGSPPRGLGEVQTPVYQSGGDEVEFELDETGQYTSRTTDTNKDYIDRRVTAVGFGIYLGGCHVYCKGMDKPVFVPNDCIFPGLRDAKSIGEAVFADRNAADAALKIALEHPTGSAPFAYFRAAGGALIAPTIFCPATTPRIITTLLEAIEQLKNEVQRELIVVAIGLVFGMVLNQVFAIKMKVGPKSPRSGAPPDDPPPSGIPVVRRALRTGPVRVNGGGTGELPGWIDLNPCPPGEMRPEQIAQRNPTGELIQDGVENITEHFPEGSVDEFVSNKLPGQVVGRYDKKIAAGVKKVLKPGAKARITTIGGFGPSAKATFEKEGWKVQGYGATYTKPGG